jgi:hypothetical protein
MQNADHEAIQALLPWYVNGTLTGPELDVVIQHLAQCVACQADVRHWRSVAAAVHLAPEADTIPSSPTAQFTQLMARIDAAEARGVKQPKRWQRLMAWGRGLARAQPGTSRTTRLTLAVQGVLMLLLAVLLFWRSTPLVQAPYRTLTQDTTAITQQVARIQLVFADDLRVSDLSALLEHVEATMVKGPTAMGVYTIAVASVDTATVQKVLQALRAHPQVRFAELITSP